MNDWKEEYILNKYNQQINLLECVKDRIKHVKNYILQKSENMSSSFLNKLSSVPETQSSFLFYEDEVINEEKHNFQNEMVKCSIKFYAMLEDKKKIEGYKHAFISYELKFSKKIQQVLNKINVFATHLELETDGAIQVRQISNSNNQFFRCKKALQNNIKANFFEGTEYSSLCLTEAFKIENTPLLQRFEEKLSETHKATLKGLFSRIDESQLLSMITFGISDYHPYSDYTRKLLRIPTSILKEYRTKEARSVVEQGLTHSKAFKLPIYLSAYSTMPEIKALLKESSSSDTSIILIILCRVIVQGKRENTKDQEIFYSSMKEAYEVHSYNLIYPEYILLCKPILHKQDPILSVCRTIETNALTNPMKHQQQHPQQPSPLSSLPTTNQHTPHLNPLNKALPNSSLSSSLHSHVNSASTVTTPSPFYQRSSSSQTTSSNTNNINNINNVNMNVNNSNLNSNLTNNLNSNLNSNVNCNVTSNANNGNGIAGTNQIIGSGGNMGSCENNDNNIVKKMNYYLHNLNLHQKVLRDGLHGNFTQFWNRINYTIQTNVHPKVIAQRAFSIPELQQQIASAKTQLYSLKAFTADLNNLKTNRIL